MADKRVMIFNGVLLRVELIDAPDADKIAMANGHIFAERLVGNYDNGDCLILDHLNRVQRVIKIENNESN